MRADGVLAGSVCQGAVAPYQCVNVAVPEKVDFVLPGQFRIRRTVVFRLLDQLDKAGEAFDIVGACRDGIAGAEYHRCDGVVDLERLVVFEYKRIAKGIIAAPVDHFPGSHDLKAGVVVVDELVCFIFKGKACQVAFVFREQRVSVQRTEVVGVQIG